MAMIRARILKIDHDVLMILIQYDITIYDNIRDEKGNLFMNDFVFENYFFLIEKRSIHSREDFWFLV